MRERAQLRDNASELNKDDKKSSVENSGLSRSAISPHANISFLQRTIGNQAVHQLYKSSIIQPKLRTSHASSIHEQEADQAVEAISRNNKVEEVALSPVEPRIQRSPAGEETTSTSSDIPETPAPTIEETPSEAGTPTPGLIVEDSVTEATTDQMKKSQFLSQLRASVTSTVEEALLGTIWSAMGCPWIDHWFAKYAGQSAQQVESAIRRYAPGTGGVSSAAGYIPIVCSRVRQSINAWVSTGKVEGSPEGVSTDIPGNGQDAGTSTSDTGGILLKGRDSNVNSTENPRQIQSQLGSGRPLDGIARSRMESAFNQDFSHVRVHADAKGAQLSSNLNARAFTIGKNIAFGQGEYQPGTLVGDALIAHELAHTIQQGKGGSAAMPMQKEETETTMLEEDADTSAVGAVASIWGGAKKGLAGIRKNTMPQLKSGLRLQRCTLSDEEKRVREEAKQVLGNAETELKAIENAINDQSIDTSKKRRLVAAALKIYQCLAELEGTLGTGESRVEAMTVLGGIAVATAVDPFPDEPVTLPLEGLALIAILLMTSATASISQVEMASDRLKDATSEATKELVDPIPLTPPMNCVSAFPGAINCATLSYMYSYKSPQAALAALKESTGNKVLKLTSKRPSTGGPCEGVGTHYGVKNGGVYIASISCCPCCQDTPKGPVMIVLCRII